jgi:hypothetical protein
LEDNATALIAATVGVVSALGAGIRTLWVRLVEKQAAKIELLEAKLEASEARHLLTVRTLERLLGKYERERGVTSSRPPKST